ncbi:MAG TPA: tRNA (adenosine(37)-N6)-dimethylallyltransferase MiaA [Isosphaeraceae bacterium]|jgi:tRNA dimethylallyltransferase|nr:tRNA (adenosine(37)-N6)-dimethylallyltransferase MiaA [Isosphaeraceae bacterium]
MAINPFHRAIYLTGPTAVGKTAVGVALAQRLNAEVIALDSMTLYRGMDIGTAKPTLVERAGVTHHLVDVLDPWESASVADYRSWALLALSDIESRGKRALFVGGTALYLKVLLRGLFEGPGADPELRQSLESEADALGDLVMHARLRRLDPITADRLHPSDRRRIIRALEVMTATGLPLSSLQTEHSQPSPEGVHVFGLERPKDELRSRIDQRVAQMLASGLVDEVRRLRSGPNPLGPVPAQAVGYLEVIDLLDGRATLTETVARVQVRTRQFAKRQATWFRGLAEVRPWPIPSDESPDLTAQRLADRLEAAD